MVQQTLLRRSLLGLTVVCVGALSACARQQPPVAAEPMGQSATEGTVTFTGGAVAAGIGYQWGSGVLNFRGRQYPFRARGLSVADVGISRISASGRVRNLYNVGDFSGNYVSATAGATIGGGGAVGVLRNQNGVTIDGIATSQGARLTLAPGGVNLQLTGY
ncbi:MAG: hypothetical protein J2P47_08400 [Acetobacteraceae bacterium]|nr:hypothetical protein [Acetobacteraceae bacterium]